MDPNATLQEMLEITDEILTEKTGEAAAEKAERLAMLVYSLNQWMTNGGFCPIRWGVR